MINDEVTKILDRKISGLSYSFDGNSRGQLELLKIDRRLYELTYDFDLKDWKKVQSKEFIENKDSIEGINSFETSYRKKQYLLTRVEKYLDWRENNQ